MTDFPNPFADMAAELAAPFAQDTVITESTPIPTNDKPVEIVKEKPMTEAVSNGNEITVTLKGGAGFDAPWIVVRGASAAETAATLSGLKTSSLMGDVAEVAKLFAGKVGSGSAPARAASRPAAPVAATPPPAGGYDKYHCVHGDRVMRQGQGQKGPW